MQKEKNYSIEKFKVGPLRTNCYVIVNDSRKECVLVDPGDNAALILDFLTKERLDCRAVFITHGHPDHVGGLRRILGTTKATLYANDLDSKCSDKWGPRPFILPNEYCNVAGGTEITVGNLVFQAIPCPGHSPGGMSYILEDNVFTGDTLFAGACGRCDIPYADQEKLEESLKKLMKLPDHYKVYPGHGKATDIRTEKLTGALRYFM